MTVAPARWSPRNRPPTPRAGLTRRSSGGAAPSIIETLGATSWYDARDLTAGIQQLPSRIGAGIATLGSTTGVDTNDPLVLPHDGVNYVRLPGTANNHLSIPKDGGWAGTLHVTCTLLDNTTTTFTTTASPILIGNTLIAAGSYKRFDVRDTDGAGALRVTIDLTTETLGQTSWTATTGQTVTVARATTGLTTAVVTRPLLMFDGTDDFLQLPVSDTPTFTNTTGAYTVVVIIRAHANIVANARIWASEGASNGATLYFVNTTNVATFVRGGTGTGSTGVGYTTGSFGAIAAVFDNGTTRAYSAGTLTAPTDITPSTGLTHNTPRIGTRATSTSNPARFEWFTTALFPSALSATDLDDVSTYLSGVYT